MKKHTVRALFLAGLVSTFSGLKRNTNGYPFITVLQTGKDGKTKAQNLYFGQKSSEIVNAYAEGTSVLQDIKNAEIVETRNATRSEEFPEGELRYKIMIPVKTGYESTSELEEVFGTFVDQDFDMTNFLGGFTAKEDVTEDKKNAKPEKATVKMA